jgi:hypothetical protein
MRVGVFSDTHDNLIAIDRALRLFEDEKVEAVVHAGDIVAPFSLKLILARLARLDVPLYAVFGNNDGERHGLAKLLPDLCDGPRHFELGGRKICLVHDLQNLRHDDELAADIVISGHTHLAPECELKDGRLYVNPAECCGWLTGLCRAASLDTDALAAQSVLLMEQERPRS